MPTSFSLDRPLVLKRVAARSIIVKTWNQPTGTSEDEVKRRWSIYKMKG